MVQAAGGIFSGAGKRLRVGLAGSKGSMLHVIDGDRAALSPLAPARRCDFSNAGLGVPRRWAPPLPSLLLREVGGGVEPFTGDGGVGLQARGRCRHRDEGQGGEEGRLAGYPPASLWLARRGTKTALLQWLLVIPGGTDLLPAHAGRKDSECALV